MNDEIICMGRAYFVLTKSFVHAIIQAWVQTTISACDVLIIGAGVMGMLSALELAEAGQNVAILDKGPGGTRGLARLVGEVFHAIPSSYSPSITALALSLRAFLTICADSSCTGIDPELLANGMLVTATKEREQALAWGAGVACGYRNYG